MVSEEEQQEVVHLLVDALPELCAELSGRGDEAEPSDVLSVLADHGLELRTAAPVRDE